MGGPPAPSSHTGTLEPRVDCAPPHPDLLLLVGMALPAATQDGAHALPLQEKQARGRHCGRRVGGQGLRHAQCPLCLQVCC